MEAAIEIAFKEDKEVIIEEALVGKEVSVGVIQYQGKTKVLPITEIISENDFLTIRQNTKENLQKLPLLH